MPTNAMRHETALHGKYHSWPTNGASARIQRHSGDGHFNGQSSISLPASVSVTDAPVLVADRGFLTTRRKPMADESDTLQLRLAERLDRIQRVF